jgi:hypothetical protein
MKFFQLLIALLLSTQVLFSAQIKGFVFEDINNNTIFDNADLKLSKVLISNGHDIVETNEKGEYSINANSGDVIFVINPAGYEFFRTDLGNNDFYYNYFPEGSPKLNYPGVEPIGKLPESVNFRLKKSKINDKFNMLLFGDSQVRNTSEINYFAHSSLEASLTENAELGVMLGDIVYDDLSNIPELIRTVSISKLNWNYLPGNHDINFDAEEQTNTDDTWNKFLGPSYYSYNYGQVHFIAINDIWHEENNKYRAEIGKIQMDFIRNDLKFVPNDKLIVLMMHIPLNELKDRDTLFALLKGRLNTISFAGHWHTNRQLFFDKESGWMNENPHIQVVCGATCGSWWDGNYDIFGIPQSMQSDGSTKGYWIVKFDGNNYKYHFNSTDTYNKSNMSIWSYEENQRLSQLNDFFKNRKDSVFVNVFGGGIRTVVKAKIDGGEEFELNMVNTSDPYYDQILFLQEQLGLDNNFVMKYWLRKEPLNSPHIWAFQLPENLKTGVHLLEVEASDPCGIAEKLSRIIRINK